MLDEPLAAGGRRLRSRARVGVHVRLLLGLAVLIAETEILPLDVLQRVRGIEVLGQFVQFGGDLQICPFATARSYSVTGGSPRRVRSS